MPLDNIPGLGGYIAGENASNQQALTGLQQAGSIMGILTAQQQLRKSKREEELHDMASEAFKTIQPDLLANPQKLYALGLQQSAAGNERLGSALINVANHQATLTSRRDPTQMERGLDVIKKLHMKDSMKPGSLTPDEQTDLHNAIAVVGQVRTALDPVTQRMETIQPLTLPAIYHPTLERYGVKNAKPGDVFHDPAGVGRKQIDQSSEKELQGFNDASTQLFSLAQDFKPTFGGWKLDTASQVALAAGRRLPDTVLKSMGKPDLANESAWWQRYYNWANDVRAAKFGLTLTGNELTAFERSTPKPSDTPEMIQRSVEQQLKIIRDKQQNRTSGLVAGGYNPNQVRETAGHERTLNVPDEEAAIKIVEDASRRGQYATVDVPPQGAKPFPKPSPQAIQRLQMNPSEKAMFEAVFGPGSAAAHVRQ